jgi:hypothetical protein
MPPAVTRETGSGRTNIVQSLRPRDNKRDRSASTDQSRRTSPAARLPDRVAPSTCIRPIPAMSELAKCSGPIARLMSGPNLASPPGPNVGE